MVARLSDENQMKKQQQMMIMTASVRAYLGALSCLSANPSWSCCDGAIDLYALCECSYALQYFAYSSPCLFRILGISMLAIRIWQPIRTVSVRVMYSLPRSSWRRFETWVNWDILAWGRECDGKATLHAIIHLVPIACSNKPGPFGHPHDV